VHVVLSGTGSPDHLEENLDALGAGPLPAPARARLVELFGSLAVGR
jgi:aryl-alcohol dehydrogenase-like predicted oxidoreductase